MGVLMSFFKARLGLKDIFRPTGIWIVSPVFGFRPGRAFLGLTLNVPRPEREIFPPSEMVARMEETTALTARIASERRSRASRHTLSINSPFFTTPPVSIVSIIDGTVPYRFLAIHNPVRPLGTLHGPWIFETITFKTESKNHTILCLRWITSCFKRFKKKFPTTFC